MAGGFSDWILPSKEILSLIYDNLYLDADADIGTKNSFTSVWYWSSSEYNDYFAWFQNFYLGGSPYRATKISNLNVRCVRQTS